MMLMLFIVYFYVMSLDTYLPVGRGRYLIGCEPESPGELLL